MIRDKISLNEFYKNDEKRNRLLNSEVNTENLFSNNREVPACILEWNTIYNDHAKSVSTTDLVYFAKQKMKDWKYDFLSLLKIENGLVQLIDVAKVFNGFRIAVDKSETEDLIQILFARNPIVKNVKQLNEIKDNVVNSLGSLHRSVLNLIFYSESFLKLLNTAINRKRIEESNTAYTDKTIKEINKAVDKFNDKNNKNGIEYFLLKKAQIAEYVQNLQKPIPKGFIKKKEETEESSFVDSLAHLNSNSEDKSIATLLTIGSSLIKNIEMKNLVTELQNILQEYSDTRNTLYILSSTQFNIRDLEKNLNEVFSLLQNIQQNFQSYQDDLNMYYEEQKKKQIQQRLKETLPFVLEKFAAEYERNLLLEILHCLKNVYHN